MKRKIFAFFILVALYGSVAFAEEGDKNKERIIWLATKISGCFDSSPDPKYWKELHEFGSQAIPIVAELTHTEENRNNPRMILVLSQLKGNDQLIGSELRRYLENAHENVDLGNENTFKMALRCLSRIGKQEDVTVIQRFECHTNIYISATAKSARIKLEQRLEQEKLNKRPVVSQPIHTPVLNSTGVVDKTSTTITTKEVVAPNVSPNPKAIPKKTFPYMVVIGGGGLLMIASILIATRKRKSGK